tara:strand:- start:364 stop:1692 length:1329 start_codon:yes stop_codon:yes gene_type:complete
MPVNISSEMDDAKWTADAIRDLDLDFDWLIIDHYKLSSKWESFMRGYVKNIFAIDDFVDREHHCDILLNQNIYDFNNNSNLTHRFASIDCIKLFGPKYALLSSKFFKLRNKTRFNKLNIKNILVFFSGSDPHDLTCLTIQSLSCDEFLDKNIIVVIGLNNTKKEKIKKLVSSRKNFSLHEQINNMPEMMSNCDLSIGSGGVSNLERMCLGLPSITLSFAENHRNILISLDKLGFISHLGDFKDYDHRMLRSEIKKKITQKEELSRQAKLAYDFVDGRGCERVTLWLTEDIQNMNLSIREADYDDCDLYYAWVNENQVRENSINSNEISYIEHKKWFKKKLNEQTSKLFILMIEGQPIGQVRFDKIRNNVSIDYSIHRSFRGKNLGKKVLMLAIREYKIIMKNQNLNLIGEVIPSNLASSRVFEGLGFKKEEKKHLMVYNLQI